MIFYEIRTKKHHFFVREWGHKIKEEYRYQVNDGFYDITISLYTFITRIYI